MKKAAIFVLSVVPLFLVMGYSNSMLGGFSNLPDHLGDNKVVSNLAGAEVTHNHSMGNVDLENEDDRKAKEKERYYWLDHVNEPYSDYLEDAREKVENRKEVDTDGVAKQYASLYKYYTAAENYSDDSDRKTELLNDYYRMLVSLKKLYGNSTDN